jgi:hypothetical protein
MTAVRQSPIFFAPLNPASPLPTFIDVNLNRQESHYAPVPPSPDPFFHPRPGPRPDPGHRTGPGPGPWLHPGTRPWSRHLERRATASGAARPSRERRPGPDHPDPGRPGPWCPGQAGGRQQHPLRLSYAPARTVDRGPAACSAQGPRSPSRTPTPSHRHPRRRYPKTASATPS